MIQPLPESLVAAAKAWLRDDGRAFFTDLKLMHGRIDCVYMDGPIPHPVHFREGMQVRNWMRKREECQNWTAHDLDDTWVALIERAIE